VTFGQLVGGATGTNEGWWYFDRMSEKNSRRYKAGKSTAYQWARTQNRLFRIWENYKAINKAQAARQKKMADTTLRAFRSTVRRGKSYGGGLMSAALESETRKRKKRKKRRK